MRRTLPRGFAGFCAVGHATASLRASEAALGVELSEQTKLLRRLNFLGELLDSHVLHAYMLVAPDFLGAPSVIPLANTAPDVVLRALRLKKLAGDLCQANCRAAHASHCHGRWAVLPTLTANQLYELRERFYAARADVVATADLFQTLPPEFERETEYIACAVTMACMVLLMAIL
ncbi:MAG: nickel-dependent hydrogenase large subunit [Chloroflexota bacterium]